jgi:enterochelin esterase-like enzyme
MTKRLFASLVCLALFIPAAQAIDDYKLGPDSMEQPGVPKGDVIPFKWDNKIFPGTARDCWIYVPKQYNGKEPACVMVFQDGGGYQSPKGSYRATIVMDNLIHKKEIPVMIGIFINPGVFPDKLDAKGKPASNRSYEYDSLTPQYVDFLAKEILPEVGKKYNLRQDAAARGICGASSGGICAFTAAWERPDLFSKVLSHIGSFTNIRGGDCYPGIVRAAKPKPIRVFLQDGSNDLDNQAGNWYLANLQMEAALKFKKYDHKTVWGDGKHSGIHGGAILPDSMRWLWRETPTAVDVPKVEPKKATEPKSTDKGKSSESLKTEPKKAVEPQGIDRSKTTDNLPAANPSAQTPAEVVPGPYVEPRRARLFQRRFRLFR